MRTYACRYIEQATRQDITFKFKETLEFTMENPTIMKQYG